MDNGSYTLKVISISGEDYTATPESNYAVEVYPEGSKTVEEFYYIPNVPYYDMDTRFEDAVLWDATYRLLSINERSFADKAMTKRDQVIQSLNRGL